LVCDSKGGALRVFENKMLRSISGPTRDKVIGGWRKAGKNLYLLSSIVIRIIMSMRMR
jgi:hypothetical protein